MKVLITDLTRMYGGHICAAGVELESGKRVRPVLRAPLSARMLSVRGGVFDIGSVVDLGRTQWCGNAPEIEDALFLARSAKVKTRVVGSEFFSTLCRHLSAGLVSIGPDLVQEASSLVTQPGRGRCSLVMVAAEGAVNITVQQKQREDGILECKIRFHGGPNVELSVTDIRLYQDDLITPDLARVRWLQERLAESPDVVLCYGLGRPYNGRHYLQLNNLHLSNAPDWRPA